MLPATAPVYAQPLGPRDVLDFYLQVSRGEDADDILDTHEAITRFSLALSAEAVAAGLVPLEDAQHSPIMSTDDVIQFWVKVDDALQTASIFDAGVILGVEFTFETNLTRSKVRTIGIKVVRQ